MTHVKHNLAPIETIDYLRFMPPELHQETKDFMIYVACKPFEKPTYCAHCGSRSFHIQARRELTHYYCRHCKGLFSPVTGTPFSKFRSHNEWEAVAEHMLAGIPPAKATVKLGKKGAIHSREKVLESIMAADFSNLHQWWLLFRYQMSTPTKVNSPELIKQYRQFQEWQQNLLQPKTVFCPRCKSKKCSIRTDRNNQAGYCCKSCKQNFSLLSPTHFKLAQLTAEFPSVFNYLLSGACNAEIHSLKNLRYGQRIQDWRMKLMAQLHDLNLDLLADWIEWKRYCRFKQVRKEQKELEKLKKQTQNKLKTSSAR